MDKISALKGLPAIIERIGEEWADHLAFIRIHVPRRDTDRLVTIAKNALAEEQG